MFGKFLGNLVSAPLRAVEKVAEVLEPIDCLDIAGTAGNAAQSLKETVEYIVDGDE